MFREAIERMMPYVPGEQPRAGQRLIKLNTNENPYPPSPLVARAIIKAARDGLRLYPSPRADRLIEVAAQHYRVSRSMILAGNGSDELLAMLFRAALGPGDVVAYALPTYSLYDTLASIQEARVSAVPLGAGFKLPLEELAAQRAKLTIVCSPNSPCGTLAETDRLDKLAHALDGHLLAIDEAYVDFAESNALRLIKRHRNVLVLRSFSKSFSLAGLRLGLCFAQPAVIEQLLKVKDSYNLNRLAIEAGVAALTDYSWTFRNIERVKRIRKSSERRLRAMGFEVPPSQSNFVLARIEGHDMSAVAAALRRRGVLVRHFPNSVFRDAIRISIGTPMEMEALFESLEPLIRPIAGGRSNAQAQKGRQQPPAATVRRKRIARSGTDDGSSAAARGQ